MSLFHMREHADDRVKVLSRAEAALRSQGFRAAVVFLVPPNGRQRKALASNAPRAKVETALGTSRVNYCNFGLSKAYWV